MNLVREDESSPYTKSPHDLYRNLISNSLDVPRTLQVLDDFHKQLKTSEKLKETQYVMETLRAMHYMCLSPIGLIKTEAMKITTQCLKRLDIATIQKTFPITSIPILNVDTKVLLKFYPSDFMVQNIKLIVYHIHRLFMSNVYDQDGGMLYEALLNALEENYILWQREVGDVFTVLILDEITEGPFHQSLSKYWLPKSLNHFKNSFYNFIVHSNFPLNLKLHTVLLAKKRGMASYLENIESFCGPRKYLMNEEPQLMMEILNVANQKSLNDYFLLGEESELVIYYLTSLVDTDSHHNPSVKKFITKLFVAGHVYIKDTVFVDKLFQIFCNFYETALRFMEEGDEAGGSLINMIWETATESPCRLVVEGYNLKASDKTSDNKFYKYLRKYGWWNCNMASAEFGMLLFNYFNVIPSEIVCDLLTKRYSSTILKHGMKEMNQLFDEYITTGNLLGIEEFKMYCKLIITTFEITGIIACISYFKIRVRDVCLESAMNETILMTFTLLTQALTQIDNNYDHVVYDVFKSCIHVVSYIVECKLYEDMDQTCVKILERFIIDTCSLTTRSSEVADLENNLLHLTKIIQMCNLKRPSVEAAKALRVLSVKLGTTNRTKILILNEAIESLKDQTSIKLSIRKNPQTRLVIHALSLPIQGDCRLLLTTIERLLEILKSRKARSVGIAYTFNCLEVIIDDVKYHNQTFKYLGELFKVCLAYFNNSNFVIRNALLQLFNVVIRRILGAKAVTGRYYSVTDIYPLYKPLIKYLIDYTTHVYSDSLNLIIQFFTEAINRYCPFQDQEFQTDIRQLKDIFYNIFTRGVSKLQRLNAAKAYVSCLKSEDVYGILMATLAQTDTKRIKEYKFLVQYLLIRLEDVHVAPSDKNRISKAVDEFMMKVEFCSFCSGTSDAELLLISQKINIKILLDIFCELCKHGEAKRYNVRQILLEALLQRYMECVHLRITNDLVNYILLYILRHKDGDMDYIFKCLDLVERLTNFYTITFSAEVVDLANAVNGNESIAQLIVVMLIALHHGTDQMHSYKSRLLREAYCIISRNLVTIRMQTILLYIHKFSSNQSDIEYLIKYLFLIMFRSNIPDICYETIARMCFDYPKTVEDAFDILLSFEVLERLVSKEAFLRCLTFFQTYISVCVLKKQDDVRFYEIDDKDNQLAYLVLALCERQMEQLNRS